MGPHGCPVERTGYGPMAPGPLSTRLIAGTEVPQWRS